MKLVVPNVNIYRDVNKIKPFLDALESTQTPVKYYALDLSDHALRRNLAKLKEAAYQNVEIAGLWGTFDNVKAWAAEVSGPIWYLSLGSIFGNDEFDIAVKDLQMWRASMCPQDRMLLGVDGCPDKEKVWKSLNTPIPRMPSLVEHGLELSNSILGHTWYRPGEWEISGVSEERESVITHQWVVRALEDTACEALGFSAPAGEEILTVKWFRWGPEGMKKQFDHSGFEQVAYWESPKGPLCTSPRGHDLLYCPLSFEPANTCQRQINTWSNLLRHPTRIQPEVCSIIHCLPYMPPKCRFGGAGMREPSSLRLSQQSIA